MKVLFLTTSPGKELYLAKISFYKISFLPSEVVKREPSEMNTKLNEAISSIRTLSMVPARGTYVQTTC